MTEGAQPNRAPGLPPRPPRPRFEDFPSELTSRPHFVCWKYELDEKGKATKVPYQPNGSKASTTESRTWSRFDRVRIAYETGAYDGVGFVLNGELLAGFDFDHCLDANKQFIDPMIAGLVSQLDSYTEISPSREGIRVFALGKLPPGGRKRGGIECYETARYLTVTGDHFPGAPTSINARQAAIEAFHAAVFCERKASSQRKPASPVDVTDEGLISKACKTSARFESLYRNGWSGDDQSSQDMWFCSRLAFWTGRDSGRMDRIFRTSALYRDKWDRKGDDYGQRTIDAAIAGCSETYTPRPPKAESADTSSEAFPADNSTDGILDTEQSEPEPPVEYSDIAINNRYADRHEIDLRYIAPRTLWLNYTEIQKYWKPDLVLICYTLAKRLLTEIARAAHQNMFKAAEALEKKAVSSDASEKKAAKNEAEQIRKAARALANVLTSSTKVHAVVTLARSHPKIAATQEQFDADNWLLNTALGAVNLRTGEIRPHLRTDYFTKITPVGPIDMETPKFDKFLRQIMGSDIPVDVCKCWACVNSVGKPLDVRHAAHDAEVQALVEYLWRLYGYFLSGDVRAHVLVLQIGDGGNGKGVLNDLMSVHVFGKHARDGYSCEIPMEALIAPKGGERHPTELMDLWHSRLAIARESEEDTRWNEGRVKKLSGGDPIKARHMRQDFVEFDATHKLVVFGQVRPTLRGASQAAWLRRLHLIPFPQRFGKVADPAKHVLAADINLIDTLAPEAPGILFKLIKALGRYLKDHDFKMPGTVAAASKEYLFSQDIVGQWLIECCDPTDPNARCTLKEMWASWQPWAEKHNEWVGKRAEFKEALERAGFNFTDERSTRNVVIGIKLKSD